MYNKIIVLLLIPIALSKIEVDLPKTISLASTPVELPQYGEIEAAAGTFVYLKLDGFKKGDTVYIELSFNIGLSASDYSLPIQYELKNELDIDDKPKEIDHSYYSEAGTSYTFGYGIKLSDDYKYLIFMTPVIYYNSRPLSVTYKVAHTKGSQVGLIILIVFIVIILLVIVAIIVHCIKKRKAKTAYNSSFPNQALTQ